MYYEDDNEQEEKQYDMDLIKDKFFDALDFIKEKYDIVVDFIDENFFIGLAFAGFILIMSLTGITICHGLDMQAQYEKYISTTIDTKNGNYSICDVYAVYNAESLWFCNRRLVAINEEETVRGISVADYYYRDEIYEYYDLKNGEKICQTHEDGFYIEPLMDLYSEEELMEHNYKLSLDNLEEEKSIEDVLSRDPGYKRK